MNPESPGESLGERQALEEEYARLVEPEISGYMQAVLTMALAGSLSVVSAHAMWGGLIERTAGRGGSPALVEYLGASPLPDVVTSAAMFYSAQAASLSLAPAETRHLLRSALGMTDDPLPGFEPGMVQGEDGSEHTWSKVGRGAAREAATEDHARSMMDLLRAEGYTHKRWYNRHDQRVRPTHVTADRQTILLEESFSVGGVALRWPGDRLAGAPQETNGCRCVLAGVRF